MLKNIGMRENFLDFSQHFYICYSFLLYSFNLCFFRISLSLVWCLASIFELLLKSTIRTVMCLISTISLSATALLLFFTILSCANILHTSCVSYCFPYTFYAIRCFFFCSLHTVNLQA